MITISCSRCNVLFSRSVKFINQNKKRGSKNYCSRSCARKELKHSLGAKRKIRKANLGKNNSMYGVHRYGKDNPNYGKGLYGKDSPRYGKKHKPETIKKISGKNNGRWNGGVTSKNVKERLSKRCRSFIRNILKRDNYFCQICNKHGGNLEVDHIMPWSLNLELRYKPENCRALCKPCHKKYGANPNYKPMRWAISPISMVK